MVSIFRGRGGPAATIQQYLDDLVETRRMVVKTIGNGKAYRLPGGEKDD
jgi:hypothetical protein